MTVVFRENIGVYIGKGSPLTSGEADGNIYDLLLRLLALEAAGAGRSIDSIASGAGYLTITYSDATTASFALPVATFNPRGEWGNATAYQRLDVVTARGLGTFLALQAHTSEADGRFDPEASDSDGDFWMQIGGRAASMPGYAYVYGADATPGTGELLLDDPTTPADATTLSIAETTDDAAAISAALTAWSTATSGRVKGTVQIVNATSPSSFAIYRLIGDGVDAGTYHTFTLEHVASNGGFFAADWLMVQFIPGTEIAPEVVEITTDTLTLDPETHSGKYLRFTHVAGCVVTVPADSTASEFYQNTEIHLRQCVDAAPVTVVEESTAAPVINGIAGRLNETAGQGAVMTLKRIDTDEWDLMGYLAEDVSA